MTPPPGMLWSKLLLIICLHVLFQIAGPISLVSHLSVPDWKSRASPTDNRFVAAPTLSDSATFSSNHTEGVLTPEVLSPPRLEAKGKPPTRKLYNLPEINIVSPVQSSRASKSQHAMHPSMILNTSDICKRPLNRRLPVLT
jgi:hypothetical protein